MARLTFQNVPTKSGGVVSGNISTGAGSPFGSGGKYEAQVRDIKAEIESKPEGFYDPPPMTLWKEDNLLIESQLEDDPTYQKAKEKLKNLIGTYDPSHPRASRLGRYGSDADIMAMQFKIDAQNKIINDIRLKITAERNAPLIKAQQEQEALEADLIRKLEIELAVQRVLDKQVINQRPTLLSMTPIPISTDRSWSNYAILGIAVVGFLLFLRSRA